MPIDYKEYHPKWSLISYLIRAIRAKWRCENEGCRVRNFSPVRMNKLTKQREVMDFLFDTFKESRVFCNHLNRFHSDGNGKWNPVVLTVAHLDHNKGNNRFWNLRAWCQRCHLSYDRHVHVNNRKYGRKHRREQIRMDFNDISNEI
jgi:hypothetical protein